MTFSFYTVNVHMHMKVVTLEDAHHGIMGVMKEVETKEKVSVEESTVLRAKVTCLQKQLDLDRKSLQSKMEHAEYKGRCNSCTHCMHMCMY